jgi:hypothetical protein
MFGSRGKRGMSAYIDQIGVSEAIRLGYTEAAFLI